MADAQIKRAFQIESHRLHISSKEEVLTLIVAHFEAVEGSDQVRSVLPCLLKEISSY